MGNKYDIYIYVLVTIRFVKQLSNGFIFISPFLAVTDIAGVVVNVGPGVKDLAAGDQVVAMLNSLVSELHSWQHLSMFVIFT